MSLYLSYIETSDTLILYNGSKITANGQTITDVETSYLEGLSANIETQFTVAEGITAQNTSDIAQNTNDMSTLEDKTQNITAVSEETTLNGYTTLLRGTVITTNGTWVSDAELGYIDGIISNTQDQLDFVVNYSSEITSLKNKTAYIATALSNVTEIDNAILLNEIYFNSGGFLDIIDVVIDNINHMQMH